MKEEDDFEQKENLQTNFAIYFKKLFFFFDKEMFTGKFYLTRKQFSCCCFPTTKQYSPTKTIS